MILKIIISAMLIIMLSGCGTPEHQRKVWREIMQNEHYERDWRDRVTR